jgi:plastocyanin
MENQFRQRVLAPILMLLGVLVGIAIIAFSVSRVLLAVPEIVATLTALVLAAYVLFLAVMVGKRSSISPRALGTGMAIGLIALLGAGLVSAQAGMRELHHGEEGEEAAAGEGEAAGQEPVEEIPADALVWVAVDVDFAEEVTETTAGEHVIAIDNQGNLPHNVVIDGVGRVDADGGGQAAATVTLEPGEYEYICDIPGHASTMSGTLVVN